MSNKMERFTNKARRTLSIGQAVAEEFKAPKITTSHILLAMTRLNDYNAYLVLNEVGVTDEKLTNFIQSTQKPVEFVDSLDLSADTKKMLEMSVSEARRRGQDYIGSAHLLAGIMRLDSATINEILAHFNVSTTDILERIQFYLETPETDDVTSNNDDKEN